MKSVTILIAGGHPTPALAVVDEIRKKYPQWRLVWVGRTYAFEGHHTISMEKRLVDKANIPFYPLTTGRLQREFTIYTIPSLLKVPWGCVQSIYYMVKLKPALTLSFGGYVSLPICLASYLFGIPIVVHEQARVPGFTNKIISMFAQKILVSYRETESYFPKHKTITVGLPIRRDLFFPPQHPSFEVSTRFPIIYITGGSTGSESLNKLLFPIIPMLLKSYTVIHQTGDVSYEKATALQKTFGNVKKRYIVLKNLDVSDLSWVYHTAQIVIGRSGANTVAELLAFEKPALLVPLPWASGDEQTKNASMLVDKGLGTIIEQEKATPAILLSEIQAILDRKAGKHTMSTREKASRQVSEEIVTIIYSCLSSYVHDR